MKIAVTGATGRLGRHVVDVLEAQGHDVVSIARSTGVDVITREGLAEALAGVDTIVDAATQASPDEAAATAFFTASAQNIQEVGERAGVRRIVLVSIVGTDRFSAGFLAAKFAHEQALLEGPIPVQILRATQFHEFVPEMVEWGRQGDVIFMPKIRTQLVAARSVAEALADMVNGSEAHSNGAIPEIGGPRPERLVEMARLFVAQRGDTTRVEEVANPDDPDHELLENGGALPRPRCGPRRPHVRGVGAGERFEERLMRKPLANSDGTRWLVLAVTVAAQFMVIVDVAVVNVALPAIKHDLHFSQDSLQWVITAYSILFGGTLLLGGRLADLLGRRRLFMAGVAVFTVGSLLSGLAWSESALIVTRGLQGLGGALLAPAALSIVVTTFREGRERNIALGVWGAASGSGGAVGVLLGGVLTSYLSWSWIFFVNLPVGVAVLAVSPWLLSESRAALAHRHFDVAGATSITAGMMVLVYAITRASQHGWSNGMTRRPARDRRRADRGVRRRSRPARRRRCCRCGSSVCGRSRRPTRPC